MNTDALGALVRRAEETSTTSLLIWRDGRIVTCSTENKKVPLYSMTKSFVSLAIGFLFDEGKIESLDTPVERWFSDREDWQRGPKSIVTLRMLMTHTSGILDHFIEPDGAFNLEQFNAFRNVPDVIEAALKLGLGKPPGSHASYSNSSADILVELVKKLSTMRIDAYVNEKLFKPLKITDLQWVSSTKQLFGTDDDRPSGADGLVLSAHDLLKVGQMIVQGGVYEGKKIISAEWIRRMASEVPENGLCMELAEAALTKTADPDHPGKYLPAVENSQKIPFERYSAALLWMVPHSLRQKSSPEVFMGWGFLGQYLMILPTQKTVAVRLYTEGLPNFSAHEENTRVSFADFEYWVRRISGSS